MRKICQFFIEGNCRYGRNCRDIHGENDRHHMPTNKTNHGRFRRENYGKNLDSCNEDQVNRHNSEYVKKSNDQFIGAPGTTPGSARRPRRRGNKKWKTGIKSKIYYLQEGCANTINSRNGCYQQAVKNETTQVRGGTFTPKPKSRKARKNANYSGKKLNSEELLWQEDISGPTRTTSQKKSIQEKYIEVWKNIKEVENMNLWPFSSIGIGGETLFDCVDLGFEEFRWEIYQLPKEKWNDFIIYLQNNVNAAKEKFAKVANDIYGCNLGNFPSAPITTNPFGESICAPNLVMEDQNVQDTRLQLCSNFSNIKSEALLTKGYIYDDMMDVIEEDDGRGSPSYNSVLSSNVEPLVGVRQICPVLAEDNAGNPKQGTLDPDIKQAFLAPKFEEGKIPEVMPPPELCNF